MRFKYLFFSLFFITLISSATIFASEELDLGGASKKAVAIIDQKPVFQFTKNMSLSTKLSAQKVSLNQYKIKYDEEEIFKFTVKNNIDYATNTLTDCGILTCDFVLELDVKETMRLASSNIGGGWLNGTAYVDKIFYLNTREVSGSYTIDGNGTYEVINYSYNETYEETNLSTLTLYPADKINITIRFGRYELKEVDIYPILFDHHFTEWSIWGTGGLEYTTIINGTNYTVHVFTSNGTFSVNKEIKQASVLVVGGGGGGGGFGGGGGSGGLLINWSKNIPIGNYSIVIGQGGKNGIYNVRQGGDGGNSSFYDMLAIGGGGGGSRFADENGRDGGSGGGAGVVSSLQAENFTVGGKGVAGQGYDGGNNPLWLNTFHTSGGGGSSQAGLNGTQGGHGGNGTQLDINGSLVYYAGGGGGGSTTDLNGNKAIGGLGGGGDGAYKTSGSKINPVNGANGLGGGGGGGGDVGNTDGASGGAGIVIIRYKTNMEVSPSISPTPAFENTTLNFNATVLYLLSYYESITDINYTIYLNHSIYKIGQKSGTWGENDSINLHNEGGFEKGSSLILEVSAKNTDGDWSDATNSSEVIIQNYVPILNATFSQNGTTFQLGDVELNITVQDSDSHEITYWVNWFKNNINQTALAQTGTAQSGDNITLRPNITLPFNVSDKWKARVWVGDGIVNSSYYETNETEILNYFNNISFYTENNTIGGKNKTAFFNVTLLGAENITAIFNFNGTNYTMINNGTGDDYKFYIDNIKTPYVKNPTTFNATWFYRANLENGSYYELNHTKNITLTTFGLFVCNNTYNQPAINYTFYDSITNDKVSATITLLAQMKTDDGEVISTSLTQTNNSVRFCIYPNDTIIEIEISETIISAGYLPYTAFREKKNYSSNITFYSIYITNSSKGSIYTFQTQNQYGSAVSGAEIIIIQGSNEIYRGVTDETGSLLAGLTELGIYQISATKDGHVPASFNFIAGATTLIPISLPTTTSSNITLPNFEEVFKHVQYTLTPAENYFRTPKNITYTISCDNNILENFGMVITKNGTVVFNQTSTNSLGGKLDFLVNERGTYTVNIWFKANGYEKYTPTSYIFTYGASGGVSNAGDLLKTNGVISGFGYYIIAVVMAMMGALWIHQYSPSGAIFVGILILCAFTFIWSDAVVITLNETENGKEGVTSLMLTVFATLTSVSIFYLKQYGA